jgi:FkbM family methyltransferase
MGNGLSGKGARGAGADGGAAERRKDGPLVSVIVAAYNVEEYLAQCLDSLVHQTLSDIEIIVVNDCSTDRSPQILAEYEARHARLRVLHLQQNAGLASARNVGMRAARGEYLGFVDADDWVDTRMYERMCARADRDGADVLIADAKVYYEDSKSFCPFYDRYIWDALEPELKTSPFPLARETSVLLTEAAAWKKLYRRTFLDDHGLAFAEGMNSYEDVIFHFSVLLRARRISLLDEALCFYRQGRPGQITARSDRRVFDVFEVFRQVRDNLAAWNVPDGVWAKMVKFEMRFFVWLARQVDQRHRREFFAAVADHLRTVPVRGLEAYVRQTADAQDLLHLLCMRRGWPTAFANMGRKPWAYLLKLYGAVHYGGLKALPPLARRCLHKAYRKLASRPGAPLALPPQLQEIQTKLDLLAAREPYPPGGGPGQGAPWGDVHHIGGKPFFFGDRPAQPGLPDAVWRAASDYYLAQAAAFRPGDVAIDVGAHVGVFSICLARKFPFLKVYALEPDPQNYEFLEHNIALNGVTNVVPLNRAVTGDGRGVQLYASRRDSGRATISAGVAAGYGSVRAAEVASLTLEGLFQEHGIRHCRLLKISAPGAVGEILRRAPHGGRIDFLCGEADLAECGAAELEGASRAVARQHFWRVWGGPGGGAGPAWIHQRPTAAEAGTRDGGAPGAAAPAAPKVSVVVPVYNVQHYLRQCLDSLAGQTFTDLEVILVDDGSTDESPAVMDGFARRHPNVRCIHKPNGGCASARNAGLRAARGEYVAFFDADDWAAPGMFQELYARAVLTRADIIQCGWSRYFQSDGLIEPADEKWVEDLVGAAGNRFAGARALLLLQPTIWRRLYRTALLRDNDIAFPEEVRMYDDAPFQFMVFACSRTVAVVNKHLYYYRLQRPGQDVGVTDQRLFSGFRLFRILDDFLQRTGRQDLAPYLVHAELNHHVWALGKIEPALKEKYFDEACTAFSRVDSGCYKALLAGRTLTPELLRRLHCFRVRAFGWYQSLEAGSTPLRLRLSALRAA